MSDAQTAASSVCRARSREKTRPPRRARVSETERQGVPDPPAAVAKAQKRTHAVPRLALTKAEAAESIGRSVDYLEDHVLAELRVVRRGRVVLIPVKELER